MIKPTPEDLGMWLQIFDEEKNKKFSLEQNLSRVLRASDFLLERVDSPNRPEEMQKFFSETGLRTSVIWYIIAEQLRT